ncbi:MAG: hypothetical protein E6G56_03765 [Actinobacteria bacterium]|nr:MAG: hypothetical protein E6G56_03765 [Actinomycetota bacterium]
MAWTQRVLVVANQTVASEELHRELVGRHRHCPTAFSLLMPARRTPAAEEQLHEVVAELRASGLDVDGRIGDADPFFAIHELWDPRRYDEILICTLPATSSRWLQTNLLRRVERRTGALVSHLSASAWGGAQRIPEPVREAWTPGPPSRVTA